MLINGGASRVRTQSVTLTLSARDPAPASGVAQMRLANSETALPGTAWRTYATNAAWTLSSGTGTKTVYVQFRDAAGNVSATVRASTTYKP